jgi:hypothetical protein
MSKKEKTTWKRYETFARKQGWENMAYPHHLGSFCYGLICSFLSIPVFLGWWWCKTFAKRASNFTIKELTYLEKYTAFDLQENIPWLVTRLKGNVKNQKALIKSIMQNSRNHLIATEKGQVLISNDYLRPIFNTPEYKELIRTTYIKRWNLDLKLKEDQAA